MRDDYYPAGKDQGHYAADAALGLEVGDTPALPGPTNTVSIANRPISPDKN